MTFHVRHQDYYGRLGVAEDASSEEIRHAFRRRAKEFHPDLNSSPEANESFLAIQEAYEVLRDEERRAAYDDPFDEDFFAGAPVSDRVDFDEDQIDDDMDDHEHRANGDGEFAAQRPTPAASPPDLTRTRLPTKLVTFGLAGVLVFAASVGLVASVGARLLRAPAPARIVAAITVPAAPAAAPRPKAPAATSKSTVVEPTPKHVFVDSRPDASDFALAQSTPRDIRPVAQKVAAVPPIAAPPPAKVAPPFDKDVSSNSASRKGETAPAPARLSPAAASAPTLARLAAVMPVRAVSVRPAPFRHARPVIAAPIYRRSYALAAGAAYRTRFAANWKAARARYLARQAYRARLIQMRRRASAEPTFEIF